MRGPPVASGAGRAAPRVALTIRAGRSAAHPSSLRADGRCSKCVAPTRTRNPTGQEPTRPATRSKRIPRAGATVPGAGTRGGPATARR
jgi:hypothetical protein